MERAIDAVKSTVLLQVSVFEGRPLTHCPSYGIWEDDMIAAYVWGLQTGYFQITRADETWSRGDEGLAMFGRMTVCLVALTLIFGDDRGPEVAYNSPLVTPRPTARITDAHRQMDIAGGADGMAIAQGKPLRGEAGNLSAFLKTNVMRSGST
jgi:hypothetical protein